MAEARAREDTVHIQGLTLIWEGLLACTLIILTRDPISRGFSYDGRHAR